MHIAFATTLAAHGSTVSGRVVPLASQLSSLGHQAHILIMHGPDVPSVPGPVFHTVGSEPFTRTPGGKIRRRGLGLVANMLRAALGTTWKLWQIDPGVIVLVKPLPANTFGTLLYTWLRPDTSVILDADDFELTANVLPSFAARAAIGWSSRLAVHLAKHIVVATPFLQDHFTNLGNGKKPVSLIVTGHNFTDQTVTQEPSAALSYIGSVSTASGHRVDMLPAIVTTVTRAVPAARLLIAGDGDDVSRLKDAFRQAGVVDRVTWHGRFSDKDMQQLIAQSSVIIDPVDASVTARAKSSFRAMLCLAYGLPLVTSNVGIRSILIPPQFHDRFFAIPADPADYAKKIIALIRQPLTSAQRQVLRDAATRYAWSALARQYERILKEL